MRALTQPFVLKLLEDVRHNRRVRSACRDPARFGINITFPHIRVRQHIGLADVHPETILPTINLT
jgi:hypothetical protein